MNPDPAALLAGLQRAVGIIAARRRGDLDGARALAGEFPDDAACAHAFLLLTEVMLKVVADGRGDSVDEVVRDLSLRLAGLSAAD